MLSNDSDCFYVTNIFMVNHEVSSLIFQGAIERKTDMSTGAKCNSATGESVMYGLLEIHTHVWVCSSFCIAMYPVVINVILNKVQYVLFNLAKTEGMI